MSKQYGYGSGFYKILSDDLQKVLPDVKSFSPTNLKYMRYFYELYPCAGNRPQAVDDSDCRQNAFGQHSRSVFLVFGSKSMYLINNKHFWVPLFPFLAIIFASFFRFMQANVSPTFISIRAFPIICV